MKLTEQEVASIVNANRVEGYPQGIAIARAAEAATLAKLDVSADLVLLREIFALCESTENECAGRLDSFKQGRAFEAKRIRQSIGTWYQDMFCGSSFMGEPVAPQLVPPKLN